MLKGELRTEKITSYRQHLPADPVLQELRVHVHVCRIIHGIGGGIHVFWKMSLKSTVIKSHKTKESEHLLWMSIKKSRKKSFHKISFYFGECLTVLSLQLSSQCHLNIPPKYFVFISNYCQYYGVWKSSSSSGTICSNSSELCSRNSL